MGALSQVAQTPAEFAKLTDEARRFYREGAVPSLDVGAQAVFSIKSAGYEKDMGLLRDLAANNVIQDPVGLARSAATLKTSMGEAEAGDLAQQTSKAFAAAQFSPAGGH
jgi:hypothetical protein